MKISLDVGLRTNEIDDVLDFGAGVCVDAFLTGVLVLVVRERGHQWRRGRSYVFDFPSSG